MDCLRCRSWKTRVIDVAKTPGLTLRRHRCLDCGAEFNSRQQHEYALERWPKTYIRDLNPPSKP